MDYLLLLFTNVFFIGFLFAGIQSILEKERRAASILFICAIVLSAPYFILYSFHFHYEYVFSNVIVILTPGMAITLLIPFGKNRNLRNLHPKTRIDERDTMFSRRELKPGSENFESYYERNTDKKTIDDGWRTKPGLLRPGSSQFNSVQFSAADASFETIEALKEKVNGPVNKSRTEVDPNKITNFLKNWSIKLGAVDVGITKLKDYHIYSYGGRGERYGKQYKKQHDYAIALTVEMDHSMIQAAPSGTIVMESGQQYLESGKIAIQLGNFIRNIGYEARAHIDGNYEVVCPLVARDAGLGEIGRMGLLMTPKLGPRVRIAVVTTNLPLAIDNPRHDYSMIDFCTKCKKCADSCPGQAISSDNMRMINGVERWQINSESCFSLWCTLGTDCGRCVSVCPYSHPDNFMHNIIRAGIKNSSLFRSLAIKLDDVLYKRKPLIHSPPKWLKVN